MKKFFSRSIALILMISMMLGISIVANAQIISKSEIDVNSKVDVVKYDVKNDSYTYGTINIKQSSALGANNKYLCYNENTFKEADGTISDKDKVNAKAVASAVQSVFDNGNDTVNYSKYGNVDSESYNIKGSVIAPDAVEILKNDNVTPDTYMWLTVGDKNGTVLTTYINATSNDEKEEETKTPSTDKKEVSVKAIVPRKMSIRLEDGTVLKSGESFKTTLDKEMKFQMCSNNWDTDTYDDNSNGIAGTVVYKFVVSSTAKKNSYDKDSHTFTICKADKTLRTDTNSCFMAYRYHFNNGDYNKQTGIINVVNTPLESLSVNLPLGSTITSDAYISQTKKDSANVFIETAEDKTLSYTDYYWNY